MLDHVLTADPATEEAHKEAKSQERRQSYNDPLVKHSTKKSEYDCQHVLKLEEDCPHCPCTSGAQVIERVSTHLFDDSSKGDSWDQSVQHQFDGVGEGDNKCAERLAVCIKLPTLFPNKQVE